MMFVILTAANEASAQSHETEHVFNITCDRNLESQRDCESESLETIAAKVKKNMYTDVQIDIKIPQLQLNAIVNFTNLNPSLSYLK